MGSEPELEIHPAQPLAPSADAGWIWTQESSGLLKEQRVLGATGLGGVNGLFASAFAVHAQNTPAWEGHLDEVYVSRGCDLGSEGLYPQR